MQTKSDKILVGRIAGVYGIKGWLKIHSFTRPIDNIFQYSPWCLKSGEREVSTEVEDSRRQGKGLIARLSGISDPEHARSLINSDILIDREQLPELTEGEYYWHELLGLRVCNSDGRELGVIRDIVETGANDVIVVEGEERVLIPWIMDRYVIDIDLEAGRMQVDWHGEQ